MGYIYTITNIQNRKIYIGQTNNPTRRWIEHKCNAKHNYQYKSALYSAMRKYGHQCFVFNILEECADEDMSVREQYWIRELNTLVPNGYNLTPGGEVLYGEHNPFFGHTHTEQTKQIISAKNTGRTYSAEELVRCRERNTGQRNPFYGKHHSEKSKRKIKEAHQRIGTYVRASERMKQNNPNADGKYAIKIPVAMIDVVSGKELMRFNSYAEAGNYVKSLGLSNAQYPGNHIRDASTGRYDKAFGYKWEIVNKV